MARILTAKRDGKIYEVFEVAPERLLEETGEADAPTSGTLSGLVLVDRGGR
jgi:hypothetical protein